MCEYFTLKEKGSSLSVRKRSLTTEPVASLACDFKEAAGGDCAGRIHPRTLCSQQPDFFMVWGTGKAVTAAPSGSGCSETRKKEKEGQSVFLPVVMGL